jgi:hypothetical protein
MMMMMNSYIAAGRGSCVAPASYIMLTEINFLSYSAFFRPCRLSAIVCLILSVLVYRYILEFLTCAFI